MTKQTRLRKLKQQTNRRLIFIVNVLRVLGKTDPEIYEAVIGELNRQKDHLEHSV